MHSSLVRLQNVFGFFTTVAFSIAACVAVSVFLFPQAPTADLKLRSVQVYALLCFPMLKNASKIY